MTFLIDLGAEQVGLDDVDLQIGDVVALDLFLLDLSEKLVNAIALEWRAFDRVSVNV